MNIIKCILTVVALLFLAFIGEIIRTSSIQESIEHKRLCEKLFPKKVEQCMHLDLHDLRILDLNSGKE